MCNLYSITKNQDAIRRLFEVTRDVAGNLPPLPGIFPDYPAPIVRVMGDERELTMMRWGMPGPPQFGGAPITNIRNTKSAHWPVAWSGQSLPKRRRWPDPSEGNAGDPDKRRGARRLDACAMV